jgi:hypothetical protein
MIPPRRAGVQPSVILALLTLLTAHRFEHPKSIRLGLERDRILIAVNYDVNPGADATQLRSLFDRDSDGALSRGEQDKLTAYLEQMAMLSFRIRLDGREAPPRRLAATPHRIGLPVSAADTLGIALLYEVALSSKAVTIEIEDRERDRAKHVPVVVDVDAEWEVHLSSQGELTGSGPRHIGRIGLAKDRPLLMKLSRP